MPDFTRLYKRKGINMKDNDFEIIKTIGENGEEVELKLLDIVNVNDVDYALLLPLDADIDNEEECEIVLMRLKQDDSDYIFETIEDEDEFELVSQAIIEDESND